MATLDEFIGATKVNEEQEILYYSNWYTKWRYACEQAGIDPDNFEKKIKKMMIKSNKKIKNKRGGKWRKIWRNNDK